MIRFYKEIRRGHGKASDMYRLWIGVERIFQGADSEGGLSVSVLSPWDPLAQTARRFLGSRKAAAFFSAAMTWAVYRYCAALAWIERGGKTAYGGECLVALAAGWITYYAIQRWQGRR